jgi:hypothetical protein
MNRRSFMKMLGIGSLGVVVPGMTVRPPDVVSSDQTSRAFFHGGSGPVPAQGIVGYLLNAPAGARCRTLFFPSAQEDDETFISVRGIRTANDPYQIAILGVSLHDLDGPSEAIGPSLLVRESYRSPNVVMPSMDAAVWNSDDGMLPVHWPTVGSKKVLAIDYQVHPDADPYVHQSFFLGFQYMSCRPVSCGGPWG